MLKIYKPIDRPEHYQRKETTSTHAIRQSKNMEQNNWKSIAYKRPGNIAEEQNLLSPNRKYRAPIIVSAVGNLGPTLEAKRNVQHGARNVVNATRKPILLVNANQDRRLIK